MATQADQLRMTLAEFLRWDDGTESLVRSAATT